MRNSLAGMLTYLCDCSGSGGSFLAETWTDDTRELHPSADKVGYNTQRKRVEYYVKAEDKWYYKWNDEIDLESPAPAPPMFQDNFETGWFEERVFTQLMSENFDTGWQVENVFTELFDEDFSINWFIDNIFAEKFAEDFQDASWI